MTALGIEMAQRGYKVKFITALCICSLSLSEAGVEIGNTHAYLIAAALAKCGCLSDFWLKCKYPRMAYIAEMPVVVATSSIALQKDIVKDCIPEISRELTQRGIIIKPLT